jgi:hypothetical protein
VFAGSFETFVTTDPSGVPMDLAQETAIRDDIVALADRGVTINAMDAKLKDYELSGDDYDEMWLFAWSLLESHASQATTDPGGSLGYGEVDGG